MMKVFAALAASGLAALWLCLAFDLTFSQGMFVASAVMMQAVASGLYGSALIESKFDAR